jgi:hypothetical protein
MYLLNLTVRNYFPSYISSESRAASWEIRWRRESAGTALGILFGNFVLSPVIGSKTTYYISDISMGEAIGIISGLYLSSGKNHKTAT